MKIEVYEVERAQFEEKTDYDNLQALSDINLVKNTDQFECPICFSDVSVGEGVTLQECLHNFCKECLASTIKFTESATVKCPFQNDEYKCEFDILEREVKALVTTEVYTKYLEKSIVLAETQATNSFHCKTPDCSGWCLFEDAVNFFLCPVCNHNNCITCDAIHEGLNCRQYQDDLALRSDNSEEAKKSKDYLQGMLENRKAMRCPRCRIIIMKKGGCSHMRCSICKKGFTWRCEESDSEPWYMNIPGLSTILGSSIFNFRAYASPVSTGLRQSTLEETRPIPTRTLPRINNHNRRERNSQSNSASSNPGNTLLSSSIAQTIQEQTRSLQIEQESLRLRQQEITRQLRHQKLLLRMEERREKQEIKLQNQELRMQERHHRQQIKQQNECIQMQAQKCLNQSVQEHLQMQLWQETQPHENSNSPDLQQNLFASSLNENEPMSSVFQYHSQQDLVKQNQNHSTQCDRRQPRESCPSSSTSLQQVSELPNFVISTGQLHHPSDVNSELSSTDQIPSALEISSNSHLGRVPPALPNVRKRKRNETELEISKKQNMSESQNTVGSSLSGLLNATNSMLNGFISINDSHPSSISPTYPSPMFEADEFVSQFFSVTDSPATSFESCSSFFS